MTEKRMTLKKQADHVSSFAKLQPLQIFSTFFLQSTTRSTSNRAKCCFALSCFSKNFYIVVIIFRSITRKQIFWGKNLVSDRWRWHSNAMLCLEGSKPNKTKTLHERIKGKLYFLSLGHWLSSGNTKYNFGSYIIEGY